MWSVGLSLWWLPLLSSSGSRRVGFSSCSTQAQWLHTGLVARRHVASSQIRDQTCAPPTPTPTLANGFLTTGPPRKSLEKDHSRTWEIRKYWMGTTSGRAMSGMVMTVTSLLMNPYTYSLALTWFLQVVFFRDDHRTLLPRGSVTTPGS